MTSEQTSRWMPLRYYPSYIISDDGRVINTNTNHERKPSIYGRGYLGFTIFGGRKSLYIHRMVAEHFIPNDDPNKKEVNHKDGIKTNNHYSNLEWVNAKQNIAHAFENGLMHKGSNRTNSKLLECQIKVIRVLLSDGLSLSDIGRYFNVNAGTIGNIRKGRSWKHA